MMTYEQKLKTFKDNVAATAETLMKSIQDKQKEAGVKGFVVGMSGGLDCCVVAALTKKAGVSVKAITMPYHADTSKQRILGIEHAKKFCEEFNIPLKTIDISETVDLVIKDTTDLDYTGNIEMSIANVLPRVRMTNLYFDAQSSNRLVLGTGNLSEITMGYFTKFGDGAFDFNPVCGLTKSEMFILAEYLGLPDFIIKKKPSADLWDEQTDEDEMGLTYKQIDTYILIGEAEDKVKDMIESAKKRNAHKMIHKILG